MAPPRRTAQLCLRVSPDEMRRLRAAAATSGETLAEFVRAAVAVRCDSDRPHTEGGQLTRSQRRVLAALSEHVGLTSVAAVARASGLSRAAARAALTGLEALGAIRQETWTEPWRRTVRERRVWTLEVLSPAYQAVASQMRHVRIPARPSPEVHAGGLPERFWSLFWNHPDPSGLRLPDDAGYIANRLLNGPSSLAALWASVHLPSEALQACLALRSTKPHTRDLICNALAHRTTRPQ
ncbi:MAG: MarR family transcriptional regulator [Acidimicrobiaceae bacterium]|nr:MarR family transcriptional regulator [Acidimicrobiaceae bacterium]